jgi:DNA end-binding protein Ku
MWRGAVSFGLVTVPVKAYSAVHDHSVHFHQLEKGTGARIRYRKVSEKTDKEVDADDIESGFEISRGHYVVVDPDELDELRPKTTRAIDISDFVDLAEIDPIYYEHTYWLAPDGQAAERAYRLLLAAMDQRQRVGIGTVVMRNKQYLAAIRPLDRALAMSTMRFADEVVPHEDIEAIPSGRGKLDDRQMRLATQIIDSLATEWDPTRYHDTYTEELRELIERKAKGEEIVVEEGAPPPAKVVDLMEALENSLAAARKGGRAELAKAASSPESRESRGTRSDGAGRKRAGSTNGRSGSSSKHPSTKGPPSKRRSTKRPSSEKREAARSRTRKSA